MEKKADTLSSPFMIQASTEDFIEEMRQTFTKLKKTDFKDAVVPDVPLPTLPLPKETKDAVMMQ